MLPRLPNIYTLLYLSLCFNVVVAGLLGPYPRQDTSATTEATKTTQDGDKGTTTAPPDASKSSDSPSITSSIEVTTTATSEPAITAIPSAINGNNPSNDSYSETPAIVEGELPLQPRLTPGWGVAGAIMLISGVIYTLIGIKNEWLHTFFSSAYLASLCVTVLIVYVMNPPVSDAIQGAYVVAGVCTGIILGGAATAFRELTEGLGCLLGGFCLAMWLLTLHEGGLLPSTTGKVIFIVAFTLAGFASYFSRYTRPYALIGLMSFAGATVTVLGIDCFSRAGLKEFWVYIWNLNDKLFPLEATTFPLTKGIRVEIAVTIVLTILGLISQLKLWRVIQEHRVKRAEERAEFQRMRDEEEADVGRRVEQDNDRERRQWETTYGDPPMSPTASRDSGVGEMENEKKGRLSQTTVQPVSPSETEAENAIEMADLSASGDTTSSEVAKQVDDGVVIANPDEDHGVTIRVSRDEGPDGVDASSPIPEPDEKAWMAGVDKARPASAVLPRSSQRYSNVTGPDVVPLPFRVPELHEGVNDDDRSSFATFADEDERSITLSKRASRASLSHRLSVGSGNLLRSLSQRSQKPKRQTGEFESPQPSPRPRGSHEELTLQDRRPQEDNRSVAATIDGMSGDEDDFEQPEGESRWTMEIKAELADRLPNGEFHAEDKKPTEPKLDDSEAHLNATRPYSTTETIATGILNPSLAEEIIGSKSKRSSATNATGKMAGISEADNSANAPETKAASETSRAGKSVSPSAASSASLTKERLPSSLSRVALSYRTNEWAKHLSHAEKPDPEELQLNEYPAQDGHSKQPEIPAPIDVEELQRTPEDGIPATSIVRSPSTMSNAQSAVPVYRSLSTASAANSVQAMPPLMSTAGQVQDSNDNRRQSGDVIIQPILEERGDENSIRANIPQEADEPALKPNPPSPTESEPQGAYRTSVPGLVSYNSPQTLIGQRDMFLRSKSQSTLLLTTPIPEGQQYVPRSVSQMDFSYNHPTHSPFVGQDADDIPLSQRKELMRQSSMLSVKPAHGNPRPNSTMRMASTPIPSPAPVSPIAAEASQFDSHQPQRRSTLPSQVHREAQLANFRQSVAAELRAGTPVSPPANNGRETPFLSASSGGLLGGMGPRNGIHEVEHNIDQQRNALLSQREQEAQRKQLERQEKEQNERTFEELMRRGDLMDAHREAMRRMQGAVKDR
ncbi:uncharacterized protein F4822DRAFT_435720 [Hypoxylon trugodes]|uniref:uncharacterized protein n=1 Tax=Hypoxylon trugodes TaxID=326681 RepID=UPI00219161D5|nr:uncharacterized protein F4822DRAFT_435720 [Hypoxylon trugodes]KAI1393634.1 hypothetical protein F4822DRAFT_435720 [Hypoxylon trugodes]